MKCAAIFKKQLLVGFTFFVIVIDICYSQETAPYVADAVLDAEEQVLYTGDGVHIYITSLRSGKTSKLPFESDQTIHFHLYKEPGIRRVHPRTASDKFLRIYHADFRQPGAYVSDMTLSSYFVFRSMALPFGDLVFYNKKYIVARIYRYPFTSPSKMAIAIYRSTPSGFDLFKKINLSAKERIVPVCWLSSDKCLCISSNMDGNKVRLNASLVSLDVSKGSFDEFPIQLNARTYYFARYFVRRSILLISYEAKKAQWFSIWSYDDQAPERSREICLLQMSVGPDSVDVSQSGRLVVFSTLRGFHLLDLRTSETRILWMFPRASLSKYFFCRFINKCEVVCVRLDGVIDIWDIRRGRKVRTIRSLRGRAFMTKKESKR